MFGKNKIASPRDYAGLPARTLKVTSLFFTLQGEGPWQGVPCVFIRFTGCHLACRFCDTYFDSGDVLSFDDIFARAASLVADFYKQREMEVPESYVKKPVFIITGGEPLLQENLTAFLKEAHDIHGAKTQIESTGSIFREIHKDSILLISPKKNDATGKQIPVHKDMLDRVDYMKFVISKADTNYHDIPAFALEWHALPKNQGKLYVSPMNCYSKEPRRIGADGTLAQRSEADERISFWTPGLLDLKKNQENHEHAAELALKYNARLTLQMHLYASLP